MWSGPCQCHGDAGTPRWDGTRRRHTPASPRARCQCGTQGNLCDAGRRAPWGPKWLEARPPRPPCQLWTAGTVLLSPACREHRAQRPPSLPQTLTLGPEPGLLQGLSWSRARGGSEGGTSTLSAGRFFGNPRNLSSVHICGRRRSGFSRKEVAKPSRWHGAGRGCSAASSECV